MRGNRFFGSGALASSELAAVMSVTAELVLAGLVVTAAGVAAPAADGASALPAVSGVLVAAPATSPLGTPRSTATTRTKETEGGAARRDRRGRRRTIPPPPAGGGGGGRGGRQRPSGRSKR